MSDINANCRNCRHWGPVRTEPRWYYDEAPAIDEVEFGHHRVGPAERRVIQVPVSETYRECLHPNLRAYAMAEGSDAYGEATSIETEPDFGCNQFEARVETPE